MKKKVLLCLFLGLFFLISLTLSVGMIAFGPSQAGANERLSDAPQWQDKEGNWNKNYLSDLASWVSDRFFLRQELISLDNYLTATVFGNSGEDKVILGKDGWLFFTETLDDYTGTDPMSQRELFSAAKNLQLMQLYCRHEGKDFAFMIAPNKNSVYSAYMPDYGVKAEETDASRLMQLLEEMDVKTVDLFTAFRQVGQPLYFAHDSHWNSRGAALGADAVNAAFGVESDYYGGDFSQKQRHDGDLYSMAYPAFLDPEMDNVYGGQLSYSFVGKNTKPDSIQLKTTGSGEGNLVAYRDSFGNLLFPYLADSYANALFSRSTSYDMTREADHILVELVERNLRYLIAGAPVMPSPAQQIELPQTVTGSAQVTVNKTQIKGTLPQMPDADSSVYVVCDGTAYEAFLLADDGFAANVPEGAKPQYLVYTIGGKLMMFETNAM